MMMSIPTLIIICMSQYRYELVDSLVGGRKSFGAKADANGLKNP